MATQSILESAASRAQEDDGADPQTGKAENVKHNQTLNKAQIFL